MAGCWAGQHRGFSRVPSLPPPLLLLLELPAGSYWSLSRALTHVRAARKKRSGWLRGSDVKTMKSAAGVSEKLQGFLWNFSLSIALLKKHILITIKCVCSHSVISLVRFSMWFW